MDTLYQTFIIQFPALRRPEVTMTLDAKLPACPRGIVEDIAKKAISWVFQPEMHTRKFLNYGRVNTVKLRQKSARDACECVILDEQQAIIAEGKGVNFIEAIKRSAEAMRVSLFPSYPEELTHLVQNNDGEPARAPIREPVSAKAAKAAAACWDGEIGAICGWNARQIQDGAPRPDGMIHTRRLRAHPTRDS